MINYILFIFIFTDTLDKGESGILIDHLLFIKVVIL